MRRGGLLVSLLRAQRIRSRCKDCGRITICEHQRARSRCKICMKRAEEPRDAGGKRGEREAGLGEAGAAKQQRPPRGLGQNRASGHVPFVVSAFVCTDLETS